MADSDDEDPIEDQKESDDDFDPAAKRLEKMKKKILGGKKKKTIELDSDLAINDDQVSLDLEETQKKPRKERKPKEPKKKRAPKPDNLGNSVNYVKTTNKLIGEIENNDLYASDEGLLNDGFGATTMDRKNVFEVEEEGLRGATIDFGNEQKPKERQFLQKMKTKMDKKELSIEQEVFILGFGQNLAKKVSANQLAANGIQISVRENLINYIKGMEKVGQSEKELLNALQS